MKILFFGTPDFAAVILNALYEKYHDDIEVVTQPDKPCGRGKKPSFSAVKKLALQLGLNLYQPESLKREVFYDEFTSIAPDICVVAAYGKILPSYILDTPRYRCINAHASLLPKYRGAAPINRVIMDGESKSGVTVMQMEKGLDTGDMLYTVETDITKEDTAGSLHDRLAELGAKAIVEAIELIVRGEVKPVKQKDELSTYAEKITEEDQKINFEDDAEAICRRIRGLAPFPGAYAYLNGKVVKLTFAEPASKEVKGKPGEIVTFKKKIEVACKNGSVYLTKLKPEGSREMEAADFINGRKAALGDIFQ